jgi:hypothetical protein
MSTVRERHAKEEERVATLNALFSNHNKKAKEEKPAFDMITFVDILSKYSQFWINDPSKYQFKTKSSSPHKQFVELVKYTFATYRVSPQLTRIWENKIPEKSAQHNTFGGRRHRHQNNHQVQRPISNRIIDEDFALWYICVAQGGSLYKQHAKKYLTKKEVHTFLNCPHDLTVNQTMIYAIAMTFAEYEGIALRIARSKISSAFCTEFIKTVIYFFAKNPPKSIEEIDDLLDFVVYRHSESLREVGRQEFSMNGFTIDSLRHKCVDWHHELRRVKEMGSYSWEGAEIPDSIIETKGDHGGAIKWHFTQIKTSKALAAEGTAMRHCVYSYRDRCLRNEVYIWSLARQDEFGGCITRKVTLELRNDGYIVQARGVANRVMKAEERHLVKTWANRNGLHLSC